MCPSCFLRSPGLPSQLARFRSPCAFFLPLSLPVPFVPFRSLFRPSPAFPVRTSLFPFGFRLRSYLFGPLRLLLLRVPFPVALFLRPVRHLKALRSRFLPLISSLSVLFLWSGSLSRLLRSRLHPQMISFPFRLLPVLSSTLRFLSSFRPDALSSSRFRVSFVLSRSSRIFVALLSLDTVGILTDYFRNVNYFLKLIFRNISDVQFSIFHS